MRLRVSGVTMAPMQATVEARRPTTPAPPAPPRRRQRRWLRWALAGAAAALLLAQVVPYGRSHANPASNVQPAWNTAATHALAARACFDCHSNLTTWPWYSVVAPVSWLVQRDVDGGRSTLNFSEWNRPQDGAADVVDAVSSGSMPPWYYTIMHPRARLSSADRQRLAAGLAATLRRSPATAGG
jgi:mono/diheme cytochrome c family protein